MMVRNTVTLPPAESSMVNNDQTKGPVKTRVFRMVKLLILIAWTVLVLFAMYFGLSLLIGLMTHDWKG